MEQVEIGITITGNDERICQVIEPGASSILDRISAAKALIEAEVRTYIFLGPVIPGITDANIGTLIERIKKIGVRDIMIDKLNIRPGIPERLLSTCSSVLSKESIEHLKYDLVHDGRIRGSLEKVRSAVISSGMRCKDAF